MKTLIYPLSFFSLSLPPSLSLSPPAERKVILGKDWHSHCLRCDECDKPLTPGQHSAVSVDAWELWDPLSTLFILCISVYTGFISVWLGEKCAFSLPSYELTFPMHTIVSWSSAHSTFHDVNVAASTHLWILFIIFTNNWSQGWALMWLSNTMQILWQCTCTCTIVIIVFQHCNCPYCNGCYQRLFGPDGYRPGSSAIEPKKTVVRRKAESGDISAAERSVLELY